VTVEAADRAASGAKRAFHNHEAEVEAKLAKDGGKRMPDDLGEMI
jgi:hypothetical protein